MAMASSCAAILPWGGPSSLGARCSAHSSTSAASTNIPSSNNGAQFAAASSALRQRKADADATEPVRASDGAGRPAILDPALQHANLMWFKGSYNAQIFVSEDEPADSVVRRFRKAVMQAGVIPECRRRRFFETPQDIAKRKLQAAQRRNKTRRFTPRPDPLAAEKKSGGQQQPEEDDDYWGYVDETL